MLRLVRGCGWGVTFCSTSPQTTSFTYQTNVSKIVCFGWGNLHMLVFCCQGKRDASRSRLQECGVRESGDTLRNRGRVGSHWITTQTHAGREEPWAWIIQPLSVIIAAHCCFCRVTDRHAAPRLCGHPAWILQHVLLITPYEYQNTIRLLYIRKGGKAWRSCVDFSSCVLADWGFGGVWLSVHW